MIDLPPDSAPTAETASALSAATRRALVASVLFGFAAVFLWVLQAHWQAIFHLYLKSYDESVNAVVSANLTRRIWPPSVRLNPLHTHYVTWLEGPAWQHIPPLFTYVPLPFFWLDSHPSAEVRRLAYALVELLTGGLFIGIVWRFERRLLGVVAAGLAGVAWAVSPFTMALVTGEHFGASDIVLAFATVVGLASVLRYLAQRERLSAGGFVAIGLGVGLSIVCKNVLGAIPAATLFGLMLRDWKRLSLRAWLAPIACLAFVGAQSVALYLSSPETFVTTMMMPFRHVGENFEGWARPWHWFITVYLPTYYLPDLAWPLFLGAFGLGAYALWRGDFAGRTRQLLMLNGGWFLWSLIAISLVKSKAPNFAFQAYLCGLFFAIYALLALVAETGEGQRLIAACRRRLGEERVAFQVAALAVVALSVMVVDTGMSFYQARVAPQPPAQPLDWTYRAAERARLEGWGLRDLVLIKLTDRSELRVPNEPEWSRWHRLEEAGPDFWARYDYLFLTGSEAQLYEDFQHEPLGDPGFLAQLKRQYDHIRLVFVTGKPLPTVPNEAISQREQFDGFTVETIVLDKLTSLDFIPTAH